tara:strand:+ start:252 stop:560 length:309 start_codon:yes stop_codon:yes gene_type:complete
MKSKFIHEAVKKISPNCAVVVRDNDTKKINFVENPDNITIEQIEEAIPLAEADFNATQYQRDRKREYPRIEELVVALYDEKDKQGIIERRKAVKAKYPKPSE